MFFQPPCLQQAAELNKLNVFSTSAPAASAGVEKNNVFQPPCTALSRSSEGSRRVGAEEGVREGLAQTALSQSSEGSRRVGAEEVLERDSHLYLLLL